MKHQQAIEAMLANFHASWMNADDKAEMNRELLNAVGKTMEELDADIETGVQNGYSVETQLEICKALMLVSVN